MSKRNPTQHSMHRRMATHDYSLPGYYHITINAVKSLRQPLGVVTGDSADEARIELTPAGRAVEEELLNAITAHYPMTLIDKYVIMPEHLHFILIVKEPLITKAGEKAHLGQVIAGFKYGCNRRYWAITGQEAPTPPAAPEAPRTLANDTAAATGATDIAAGATAAIRVPAASGGGDNKSGARRSTGRQPLFAQGYCNVMPVEAGQLDTQRQYILNNPRSRWLRMHDPRLQLQHGGIDTALTIAALRGYLKRECQHEAASPEALAAIESRLLTADGKITCDSYGDRALLQHRLLPVVCHRRDAAQHAQQKTRCQEAAAQGAVLVSPRIAKGEQAIIDEAIDRGYAVVLINDNGFTDRYHPSESRMAHCKEGKLLLLTPWQYKYRGDNDAISVMECKTMNCIAQALCRLKDSWWKEP